MTKIKTDLAADPFSLMQAAVDIVASSPHETNKIAATMHGFGINQKPFKITRTNFWPAAIAQHFGQDEQIGNSSGTIHAEIACILDAPCTKNASLFLTDPPCPNCAKNIAEAGIKTLYIDHKGFEKDFAQRRGYEFENLSLPIFRLCGIDVFEIRRKDKIMQKIQTSNQKAAIINPAILSETATDIEDCIKALTNHYAAQHFACALVRETDGTIKLLQASAGIIGNLPLCHLPKEVGKYNPVQQPLNRLLMAARFYGLDIVSETLYCSRIPTARELVNMIGAGLYSIKIGDHSQSRDLGGLQAYQQLKKASILQ